MPNPHEVTKEELAPIIAKLRIKMRDTYYALYRYSNDRLDFLENLYKNAPQA